MLIWVLNWGNMGLNGTHVSETRHVDKKKFDLLLLLFIFYTFRWN